MAESGSIDVEANKHAYTRKEICSCHGVGSFASISSSELRSAMWSGSRGNS